MKKVLSKILSVLKYILLLASFAIILYGMIITYNRLNKNLIDLIPVFIPFILLFILYIINLFLKSNKEKTNLLLNFTSVLVFAVIIIIGLRAKFDNNMLLYYKYNIEYNPSFLADNISIIKIMLYSLFVGNVLLIISDKIKTK